MKRIGMILGVVGLLLGVAGCHQQVKVKVPQKNEPAFVTASKSTLFAHQQKILETFVRRQLVHGGGVYTNYKNTSHVKNMASGHEMLSESSGL